MMSSAADLLTLPLELEVEEHQVGVAFHVSCVVGKCEQNLKLSHKMKHAIQTHAL